jgi:hypothetical protein
MAAEEQYAGRADCQVSLLKRLIAMSMLFVSLQGCVYLMLYIM